MTKSKMRRGVAVAAALLMIVLEILAVRNEGFLAGKAVLALLLSLLAGGVIALDITIPKKLSPLIFLLLPAASVCCMEFFTHVPWDLTPTIFFLNYLFYLVIYLIITTISGNMRWGGMFAPVFPALVGTVNYFIVSFRSSPLVPWDLYSLRTAASVADNYTLDVSWRLYFVLMGFLWIAILGEKLRFSFGSIRRRLIQVVLSAALMAAFVSYVQTENCEEVFGLDDILFTPNVLYRNNGFMVAYLANLQYLHIEKPQGYSADAAQKLADTRMAAADKTSEQTDSDAADDKSEKDTDKPNILVIMNEAFSDLSVYGDFATTEDYMPFWRSLKENTVRGNLYVSVKGGNTANTEFEFLTGSTMAFLPAGSVPYQQFLNGQMPSLASWLGSMGYTTAALHPYYSTGWSRDKVYQYLGFDKQYFRDTGDFPDATLLRGWVDDASAFDKLIELYEKKDADTPLFAFEVTMQNHGGYSKEYEDLTNEIQFLDATQEMRSVHQVQTEATEKYLTLIKKTDEALEELISYFEEEDEKTIILMFGDHQPAEYITNSVLRVLGEDTTTRNDTTDKLKTSYEVPFVMWANYDIGEKEVDAISANYLNSLLADTAGLEKTDYQKWLQKLEVEYPVITANFYQDADGTFHSWGEEKQSGILNDYAILQYNNLVDKKHRISGFFQP